MNSTEMSAALRRFAVFGTRKTEKLYAVLASVVGGTGHRGAVSYPRLVLDRHHSQPAAEQLLDEIVLLIVNRRPAQRADAAHRVEQAALLVARREVSVAGRLDALGNLVQRPIQRPRLPVFGVGRTV
jgi:hypothetical protein